MNALPVARLFGFEIRVHVSWAIILALIAVSVVTQAGLLAPGASGATSWLLAAVIAGGFLLSALAHELGHAVAARRAGLPGGPVVVYVFGGAAGPELEATHPRDEALIALAGPLVSLAIGAAVVGIFLVTLLIGGPTEGAVSTIGRIAVVLGALNLLLGLVNLLPAYPLDGGRVVRAIAWQRSGDASTGLRVAAASGRWLGRLVAVVGFAVVLTIDPVDGLFLAAFGWFLITVARAAERSATVDDLLLGSTVDDVMERDTTGVPAGLTLDTFAEQLLSAETPGAVPVLRDHEFIGLLGARQVARIRRDRWPTTRAADLVAKSGAVPSVTPSTPLRSVLDLLQQHTVDGLPVRIDGVFAGIVTQRAVAAHVRERARQRGVTP
jgi:Zn-dependent protease